MNGNKGNLKDGKGRFLSGNNGGGRPKGARSKWGEKFLGDLQADWEAHGMAAILQVRQTKPEAYLKIVATLLPHDIKISNESQMTDDDLLARIRQLADMAGLGFAR